MINNTIKQLGKSVNQPRRILTQESVRPDVTRHKSFNFNTVDCHHPIDLNGLVEEAKGLTSQGLIGESELLLQKILREDPENK